MRNRTIYVTPTLAIFVQTFIEVFAWFDDKQIKRHHLFFIIVIIDMLCYIFNTFMYNKIRTSVTLWNPDLSRPTPSLIARIYSKLVVALVINRLVSSAYETTVPFSITSMHIWTIFYITQNIVGPRIIVHTILVINARK